MNIEMLPGLTPEQVEQVRAVGIRTCQQLVRAKRRKDRLTALVRSTGLPAQTVQEIVQCAELAEIRGIGPAVLAKLLRSGVTSLAELAAQEPEALRLRLREVSPTPPNLAVIEQWILQARQQTMW
jgi:predicted RecB family nuclease